MITKTLARRFLYGLMFSLFALLMGIWTTAAYDQAANGPTTSMVLRAPSFIRAARAEEASVATQIRQEAGIAAYFQTGSPINLAAVKPQFRTIERQTEEYIIGSAAVANYGESEDVHLYVHKDGWVMTYYLAAEPAGKVFDWKDYQANNGAAITTKLENTIANVLVTAGIPFTAATYYDFRYPNATHLMLIADANQPCGEDSFQVTLPGSYSFFERGWFVANSHRLSLNDASIGTAASDANAQGILLATQLRPDEMHIVKIGSGCNGVGGLALIYKEQ